MGAAPAAVAHAPSVAQPQLVRGGSSLAAGSRRQRQASLRAVILPLPVTARRLKISHNNLHKDRLNDHDH